MSDNYIVINGKRTELTDEQLKALGIEVRKNPFEKVDTDNTYYFINAYGDVDTYMQLDDFEDHILFDHCNYFNDDSVARQVALHQLLYRKLLKFAYDNDCIEAAEWGEDTLHYFVVYDADDLRYGCDYARIMKIPGLVYFSSEEAVMRAIEEVVKPFMKEHPDFVW